ncbi:hypothetical protein [Reyranella sp.]|uniref:hypothetical protein n=1 Tax=Reyranella sp. TaxID=1929291 RepID=UPI003D14ABFD
MTLGVTVATNAILCAAIGALVAGRPGGQLGLVVGICISFLPQAWRGFTAWLGRSDNILRFVAREATAPILRGASRVVDIGETLLSPIATVLRVVLLIVHVLADLAGQTAGAILGRFGRTLATPLGLANLAAVAIVAADLGGLDFTPSVAFLGFAVLVLVLLVSENEARSADKASGSQT